jgi:probable rRNA maturation factor
MIRIYFANCQKYLPVKRDKIFRAYKKVIKQLGYKKYSVSLVFVDNKEIKKINKRFLKHDNATDVISFPLGEKHLDGEIIVSAEEAVRQARLRKINPQNELLLYCIHGLLHLLGFDDTTPAKRKLMGKQQDEIMESLS